MRLYTNVKKNQVQCHVIQYMYMAREPPQQYNSIEENKNKKEVFFLV